jgi:hypothetical protein
MALTSRETPKERHDPHGRALGRVARRFDRTIN